MEVDKRDKHDEHEIYEMLGRMLVTQSSIERRLAELERGRCNNNNNSPAPTASLNADVTRAEPPSPPAAKPRRRYCRREKAEKALGSAPREMRDGTYKFEIPVGSHFAHVDADGGIKLSPRYTTKKVDFDPDEKYEAWLAPGDWSLLMKPKGALTCKARQKKRGGRKSKDDAPQVDAAASTACSGTQPEDGEAKEDHPVNDGGDPATPEGDTNAE